MSGQPTEQQLRVDLAAAFRLAALRGWDDAIFTHMSVRVGDTETFLINPIDKMFDEMCASSLIKIDVEGRAIGSVDGVCNPAGFIIHSAIHGARHDAKAIIHLHTPAGQAVSAMRCGLLPATQTAMIAMAGGLATHEFEGIATRDEEKARLVADLAGSHAMILRNHGNLAVGETVADAFLRIYALERACEAQCLMLAGGLENVSVPDEALLEQVRTDLAKFAAASGLAWQAWLRKLDRIDPSYRH